MCGIRVRVCVCVCVCGESVDVSTGCATLQQNRQLV